MRPSRPLAATALAGALALSTQPAEAKPPTPKHVREYLTAYATARRLFGPRAPGCKLVGPHASCHSPVTDARLTRSFQVLARMLAPSPAPPPTQALSTVAPPTNLTLPSAGAGDVSAPSGGLIRTRVRAPGERER